MHILLNIFKYLLLTIIVIVIITRFNKSRQSPKFLRVVLITGQCVNTLYLRVSHYGPGQLICIKAHSSRPLITIFYIACPLEASWQVISFSPTGKWPNFSEQVSSEELIGGVRRGNFTFCISLFTSLRRLLNI